MASSRTRATGPAAALIALALAFLLGSAPALAAPAPDPVAACDGTAYTTATVDGRDVVTCTDGRVRDWQRVRIEDAHVVRRSDGGAETLRFTVSRPEAGNAVTFAYATADGTARAGTDYTAASGTFVLEADETAKTLDVPVTSALRGEELQMRVDLRDDAGVVRFVRDHAIGVIANRYFRPNPRYDAEYLCDGGFYSYPQRTDGDYAVSCLGSSGSDPWTTFAVSSPQVDPQAGVATFEIVRAGEPYASVFLTYETADGTARAGVDYTGTRGTIPVRYMQSRVYVTVPVNPAAVADGDKTFSLTLGFDRPSNRITANVATATIRHLAPPLGIARVGQPLAAAPDATAWQWQRCDAAGACADLAGETTATYTPTAADEGQRLRVRATAPDPSGAGTLIAETPLSGTVRTAAPATPSILTGPPLSTSARGASFTVTGGELDARYECSLDGAAFADCGAGPMVTLSDLPAGQRTLEVRQRTADGLASGTTSWSWTVVATPDAAAACDGTPFTTSTVNDREVVSCTDGAVRDWQRVAIRDARVTRSTSGTVSLRFTVARPEAGNPVFLTYATADGTARAGADFTASSGTFALEADKTSTTIEVPVLPSASAGDDRQFAVALSAAAGSEIAFDRDRAVGTIANEVAGRRVDGESACDGGLYDVVIVDRMPVVRCLNGAGPIGTFADAPARVDRHAGAVTFKLERGSDASPNWVAYETVDGTARAGVDYTATSGTIALGSGRRVAYVRVPVNPAVLADGDRAFSLRLSAGGVLPVAERELTATIRHAAPTSGTPRVGQPLGGSVAGDATSREWERCDEQGACLTLPGATDAAYVPVSADLGRRLRVRATLPGDDGATIVVHTPLTAPVRGASIATPTISGGPPPGAVTDSREATFALSGKEDDATYECSLDGAGFSGCGLDGGEARLTGLASGGHTLAVRQRTVDGIVSAERSRAWTVASAPDAAAACDGTAYTSSTVDGREVVSCSDGAVRDWQRVAVRDARVVRGTSGAATLRFAVTRPEAGNPVFLAYATADDTARAGTDYTAGSGSLVLEADQTSATLEVPVLPRATSGDDLRLAVQLADAQGGVVAFDRARAVGVVGNEAGSRAVDAEEACDGGASTIVTVEGQRAVRCLTTTGVPAFASFAATPVAVDPHAGVATFTLVRGEAPAPVWVAYETVDGSARAGVDYTATSGRVKLDHGRRIALVTVPVDPSAAADGDRAFSLRLSTGTAAVPIDGPDQVATIRRAAPTSGTPRAGRPLSGAAAADANARQWERCDEQGACLTLADATGADYAPVGADVGRRLRVRATLPGDDGATIVSYTQLSAPVRRADVAQPSLGGGPAEGGETSATSATFALVGKEDDAAYECSLDGAAFAPCGAGDPPAVALDGLALGDLSVALRQRTVDGIESGAVTRSWTVVRPAGPAPGSEPRPIPRQGEGSDPSLDPSSPPRPQADPPRGGDGPGETPGGDTPPGGDGGAQPGPGPDAAARVTGRRQQARSVANAVAGRTNVVLRCSAACALDAPLTIGRAAASRLGLRNVRVGRAAGAGQEAGLVRLRVRFDTRVKALLLRLRGPLTVVATVPNPRGGAVAVRFVLRPARG